MRGQPEESQASNFLHLLSIFCDGPVRNGPYLLWEIAGGKKCAKKLGVTAFVALPMNNVTLARARRGPEFFSRGRRAEASLHLKGQSEHF
jgi:hypothetical protein